MVNAMTHAFKPRLCTIALALLLGFSITSCLPGKEEEKKVIAQSVEATQSVQAEKLAADLANAGQKLMAVATSTDPTVIANAATTNSELKTVSCGTAPNIQVVAYIPKTSKLVKKGQIPMALGQRMRNQLQGSFKSGDVVMPTPGIASINCVPTIDIAENSPVLILNDTVKALETAAADTSKFISVQMSACPGGKPGVIVTKTLPDGSQTVDSSGCGTAMPTSLPQFTVSAVGEMPDYEARLRDGNNIASAKNLKCVAFAGSNGCIPYNPGIDKGTKIDCGTQAPEEKLMANPDFDATPAVYTFVPAARSRDCGRGWAGTLTAKVKVQSCKVIRNGVEVKAAKVYDIAYVGAKCDKNNVITWNACPASSTPGHTYFNTGHVMQQEDLEQHDVLSLTPIAMTISGQNISNIAYQLPNKTTNMIPGIPVGPQSVVTAANPNGQSFNFFTATSNISASPVADFDQNFVTELKALNKMQQKPNSLLTCFAKAQDCYMEQTPAQMEVVVDRSAVMNAPVTNPIYETRSVCRATMANLFNPNKRQAACQAAHDWQALANSTGSSGSLVQTVLTNWAANVANPFYRGEPAENAANLLQTAKNGISASMATQLNGYETTMKNALISSDYDSRLMYGLAVGQDCNPPVMSNGFLKVQEDTYGSCMSSNIFADQVPNFMNGEELKSCQTSCPGECATYLVKDSSGNVLPPAATRVTVADKLVKNSLVPRLPLKANVVYSEVVNESVTAGATVKGSATGVVPNVVELNKNVAANIFSASSKTSGGNEVPLFQAIDNAIDRMRAQLDQPGHRNDAAKLVIFGSNYDTKCDNYGTAFQRFFNNTPLGQSLVDMVNWYSTLSLTNNVLNSFDIDTKIYTSTGCPNLYQSKYFGRNICQPEPIPSGYMYHTCQTGVYTLPSGDRGCNPGNTRETPIPTEEVLKNYGGIDTFQSRDAWAHDHLNGYTFLNIDASYDKNAYPNSVFRRNDFAQYQTLSSLPVDNDGSLVGFIGRHYPNVKVYYVDLEGGSKGLGTLCNMERNHDPNQAHAYFRNKQIFFGYDPTQSLGFRKTLEAAIEQATGGGTPSDEAGEEICKAKFGLNVIIDKDTVPNGYVSNLTSFDAQSKGQCEKAGVYNQATGTLDASPAPLLPSPLTSTVTPAIGPGDCVKGIKSYLLTSPC